jgi:hypothetical protein
MYVFTKVSIPSSISKIEEVTNIKAPNYEAKLEGVTFNQVVNNWILFNTAPVTQGLQLDICGLYCWLNKDLCSQPPMPNITTTMH